MKLTVFLLTVVLMNVYASGSAQSVTLSGKNMQLKKVFSAIKQQTGYHVFFEAETMNAAKNVSFNVNDMPLQAFLDIILKDQPLAYEITSKTISIIPKSKPIVPALLKAAAEEAAPLAPAFVYGTIETYAGEPVSGASIRVKGTNQGTVTNAKGYFSLEGIPDNAVLLVSSIGFKPVTIGIRTSATGYTAYAMDKVQAGDIKATAGNNVTLSIKLQASINELDKAEVVSKRAAGVPVEMKNRRHQTLSQLLEGSVPGLTLKTEITTTHDLFLNGNDLEEQYERFKRNGLDMSQYPTYESYLKFYYDMSNQAYTPGGSTIPQQRVNYTTQTTNSGVIPELRGASGFTGGQSGLLVVIDGFPQDNFPADYPMNNVESIRIIRDPAECVKWGPKAAGGIIMITTTGAQPGKLQINYSTNLFYSERPDNSNGAMQLASSKEILDYYKEGYDKGLAGYLQTANVNMLTPAQRMLYYLGKGTLSQSVFQQQWDSMSLLSNRGQLRNLQQDIFSHNHTLSVMGGSNAYRFNVSGTYRYGKNSARGSHAEDLLLNIKNDLRLFKGKLVASLDVNTINSTSKDPGATSISSMDPYEMLVDKDGSYVYNNYEVSPELNNTMQQLGFFNYGINPIEDQLNSSIKTKISGFNSRLNVQWDLAKNLQWSTSVQYNPKHNSSENWDGIRSSTARRKINEYGIVRNAASGNVIDFYVPPGDIMRRSSSNSEVWNVRSGLTYKLKLGNHTILAGAGMGAGSEKTTINPDTTLYGYNKTTGTGLPIMYTGQTSLSNYLGRAVYPLELLLRSMPAETISRNTSFNGNFTYSYKDKYEFNTGYASVFLPISGGSESYASLTDYSATGTWNMHRESFFHIPWINSMKLSALFEQVRLPELPATLSATRTLQTLWNTNSIFVSAFTPAQLNGQVSTNIGGQYQVGLSGERITFNVRYNHPSQGGDQLSGGLNWDITRERFFRSKTISSLSLDVTVADISPYQGLALMMSTNTPKAGGGYSMISVTNFELLPAHQQNQEAHGRIGILKDRFTFDINFYRSTRTGIAYGTFPTDPATGLGAQPNYSKMLNKGVEMALMTKIIDNKNFLWMMNLNGAYNVNESLNAPNVNFSMTRDYLTATRDGYATDNIWSYNWAGLDATGNPQVYNSKKEKAAMPDSASLVYSGRLRAPWTGAIIQNLEYKNFFFSARAMLSMGHVFRVYTPAPSGILDKHELISKRWKQAGDEAFTDVPVMAAGSISRSLVIQNSTNTIEPADNLQLREIQFGWSAPATMLKNKQVKGLTISAQVRNVAVWARNKYGIDPTIVSNNGLVGYKQPVQYALSVNLNL
ncbi:SusC/RagA family TonB-linked outer membrane protein [uncultured Chitinophaga sp.]|uniref:SusC/RagA family TonB-linked outer membrane protein n=1 Tax=uncultured Chitinophaga sp. TaxID=339340 RepID=UPI0025EA1DCC|nr:SusC/RagA family TonB-linked outer membrane protein [uncultured Chitinophaga sp.]